MLVDVVFVALLAIVWALIRKRSDREPIVSRSVRRVPFAALVFGVLLLGAASWGSRWALWGRDVLEPEHRHETLMCQSVRRTLRPDETEVRCPYGPRYVVTPKGHACPLHGAPE